MIMYRVSENKNGEIILLAIFRYYQDAVDYILKEMAGQLFYDENTCILEIYNKYKIKPIDIENIT